MFNKEKFITNLLVLRTKQGLSQAQMGEAIGLSKQGVNEIEKGRNKITLERATLLSDLFNVSLDYLAGRTNDCDIVNSNQPAAINEGHSKLSTDEEELLQYYRQLPKFGKGQAMERLRILAEESALYDVDKSLG